MKKIWCLILVCVLVLSPLPVKASEVEDDTDDAMLIDLIEEQYAAIVEERLRAEDFPEELKDVDLTCPIMQIYVGPLQLYVSAESMERIVPMGLNKYGNYWFAVFEEIPIEVSYRKQGTRLLVNVFDPMPTFILDIQTGTVHQNFKGKTCEITEVYCFSSFYYGSAVVYETDGGRFVHFYEHDTAQAVEYTWDEFKEYSIAFVQSHSNESIKDILNDMVGGGSGSFLEFVEEYKAEKEAQRQAELALQRKKILYISLGAVAVVGAAVTAVLLLRRKRKCKTCEE